MLDWGDVTTVSMKMTDVTREATGELPQGVEIGVVPGAMPTLCMHTEADVLHLRRLRDNGAAVSSSGGQTTFAEAAVLVLRTRRLWMPEQDFSTDLDGVMQGVMHDGVEHASNGGKRCLCNGRFNKRAGSCGAADSSEAVSLLIGDDKLPRSIASQTVRVYDLKP